MAWEKLTSQYPNEIVVSNEFGEIDRHGWENSPDIKVISLTSTSTARDMVIQTVTHLFSKNNDYMRGIDYDVYAGVTHPDPCVYPLNVYGMAMLQDYLIMNGIESP